MPTLKLTVSKLTLKPCCPAPLITSETFPGGVRFQDIRGNRWEYTGEREAPAYCLTYDRLQVFFDSKKSPVEFRISNPNGEERIVLPLDLHPSLNPEGSSFMLVVAEGTRHYFWQFLRREEKTWARAYRVLAGKDFFYLTETTVVLMDHDQILMVDLKEGSEQVLMKAPSRQWLYKAHVSKDRRHLLAVFVDEETEEHQTFGVYTFRTGSFVTLQEGDNDVPAVVQRNLSKAVFPINMTQTGLRPSSVIKSLIVRIR